ncbi:NAD(P)-binding protein [Aspergillus ibericus CBS 121593]|uniref:NAD(P)-binding protein n=1 Tax=Aspergillus ibericus CBS 121593 TaxID=1448316 RepID=A0A395GM92_9EURO|nr:NAD(P)-binding protein [Aspergillus ibericus CBS 121593]RAK96088.1 NAD(P)-binding protein [Aspergillus ibericus CBS 121593]
MVKIAIAGGSGNVAQEIIDVLVAAKKHEIVILFRKVCSPIPPLADYNDPAQLTQVLQGVHTVLSFVTTQDDSTSKVQKNLIDAAVQAGVKRFAPSEWASWVSSQHSSVFANLSRSGLEHLSWYTYKRETRRSFEYTLFQSGLFVNYLTHPHQLSRHVHSMETPFDFANRRASLLEGGDEDRLVLTAVQDVANVVARAIDFKGEWPVVGGIRGTSVTIAELIALGEKIRGA